MVVGLGKVFWLSMGCVWNGPVGSDKARGWAIGVVSMDITSASMVSSSVAGEQGTGSVIGVRRVLVKINPV